MAGTLVVGDPLALGAPWWLGLNFATALWVLGILMDVKVTRPERWSGIPPTSLWNRTWVGAEHRRRTAAARSPAE